MKTLRIYQALPMIFAVALLFAGIAYSGDKPDKFPVSDVTVEKNVLGMWEVMGQISNNSGRDYTLTVFKMSFFDENNKLLGTADFIINNFEDGEVVTFEDSAVQKDIGKWKSYKIRLESGM